MKKKVLGLLMLLVMGIALTVSNPFSKDGVKTNKAEAGWVACAGDGMCTTIDPDQGFLLFYHFPIYAQQQR